MNSISMEKSSARIKRWSVHLHSNTKELQKKKKLLCINSFA